MRSARTGAAAKRSASFDRERFDAAQYTTAHDEVIRLIRIARGRREMPQVDSYIPHLFSMALHKAGVIAYVARLGGERSTLWNLNRPVQGRSAKRRRHV